MMARKGRTCVAPDCERRAASGSMVCTEHRDTALGEQTERELATMTRRLGAMARLEDEEEKRQAYRAFRRQLMRGDYAAVFSSKMTGLLDQAGEDIDLKLAIGSLRVGIMRVLTEEEHPSRMAHALAKLTFAMGRAMTLQAKWTDGGGQDGELAALFNDILSDVHAEEREATAGGRGDCDGGDDRADGECRDPSGDLGGKCLDRAIPSRGSGGGRAVSAVYTRRSGYGASGTSG